MKNMAASCCELKFERTNNSIWVSFILAFRVNFFFYYFCPFEREISVSRINFQIRRLYLIENSFQLEASIVTFQDQAGILKAKPEEHSKTSSKKKIILKALSWSHQSLQIDCWIDGNETLWESLNSAFIINRVLRAINFKWQLQDNIFHKFLSQFLSFILSCGPKCRSHLSRSKPQ